METIGFHHSLPANYAAKNSTTPVFARFLSWCQRQENSRILWIGLALAGHGCIITPLTIMVVVTTGNSLALFMAAMAAMGMALVVNLAALPTRITIPVFVLSILIDLGIIVISLCMAIGT